MASLINALVFLFILFFIFLVCREIVCWYWKINERLAEQRKTNRLLAELLQVARKDGPDIARKILGDKSGKTDSKISKPQGGIEDVGNLNEEAREGNWDDLMGKGKKDD